MSHANRLAAIVAAGCLAVSPSLAQDDLPDLQQTYLDNCAICHGVAAEGVIGPTLAPNAFTADATEFVLQILRGDVQMPPFADQLSDEEIAAIVNYIRTELQAYEELIDAAFVAALR